MLVRITISRLVSSKANSHGKAALCCVDRERHKLEVRTEVLPSLLSTRIKAVEEALLAQCFMHWRIPFPFASFPRCGLHAAMLSASR